MLKLISNVLILGYVYFLEISVAIASPLVLQAVVYELNLPLLAQISMNALDIILHKFCKYMVLSYGIQSNAKT